MWVSRLQKDGIWSGTNKMDAKLLCIELIQLQSSINLMELGFVVRTWAGKFWIQQRCVRVNLQPTAATGLSERNRDETEVCNGGRACAAPADLRHKKHFDRPFSIRLANFTISTFACFPSVGIAKGLFQRQVSMMKCHENSPQLDFGPLFCSDWLSFAEPLPFQA